MTPALIDDFLRGVFDRTGEGERRGVKEEARIADVVVVDVLEVGDVDLLGTQGKREPPDIAEAAAQGDDVADAALIP